MSLYRLGLLLGLGTMLASAPAASAQALNRFTAAPAPGMPFNPLPPGALFGGGFVGANAAQPRASAPNQQVGGGGQGGPAMLGPNSPFYNPYYNPLLGGGYNMGPYASPYGYPSPYGFGYNPYAYPPMAFNGPYSNPMNFPYYTNPFNGIPFPNPFYNTGIANGFGMQGFNPAFGNAGFGNPGFGNAGFGNPGFGNAGFGNPGLGNGIP